MVMPRVVVLLCVGNGNATLHGLCKGGTAPSAHTVLDGVRT